MISNCVLLYLQHILLTYALNVFFILKITITELPLHNANSVIMIILWGNNILAYVCQSSGKFANTKTETMRHYKKKNFLVFYSKF